MFKSKSAEHIATVDRLFSEAVNSGLLHLNVDDQTCTGRTISLDGEEKVWFGSCSYLGLELDSRLKAGAIGAVMRYGTQFASSRVYLSASLYEEVEALLEEMYQLPIILGPTLTLSHQSLIPTLIEEGDAIIIDHQAHTSINMAVQFLRNREIKIEMIRHNNMEMLESRIKKLKGKYNRIWYLADGIYSMYGDMAPVKELRNLLDTYEQFHLYIDDAHGSGCMGPRGAGYVYSHIPNHPRMILTTSLAKSFATAGAVMVFPNEELRRKVRTVGNTMTFSGPIQPPMLGAIKESIKIHLSNELQGLQDSLKSKVSRFNYLAEEKGLPIFSKSESPIFYLSVGKPEVAYNMVNRLKNQGYFTNLAIYPAVPLKNSGVRLALTNHLSHKDIENLLDLIEYELPIALREEKSNMEEVYEAFRFIPNTKVA